MGGKVGVTLGNLQSSLPGASPLQLRGLKPAGTKCLSRTYPLGSSHLIMGLDSRIPYHLCFCISQGGSMFGLITR